MGGSCCKVEAQSDTVANFSVEPDSKDVVPGATATEFPAPKADADPDSAVNTSLGSTQAPGSSDAEQTASKEEQTASKEEQTASKEESPAESKPEDTAPEKSAEDLPYQDRMYAKACQSLKEPIQDVAGNQPRRPSSVNISFQDYAAKHSKEFEKILELEKPDDWTFKKEEQSVKVYTKAVAGSDLLYFKGVGDFECEAGPLELLQAILRTEERPMWDELCQSGETPQFYPPFYKYAYVRLKARAGIISARDILSLGRLRFEDDGGICIAMASCEHPDYPEKSSYVRVIIEEAGYIIRPTEKPGTFTVTWTGCVNPRGWLPVWLVNLVVTKQAITLAKIKEHIVTREKKA